MPSPATWSPTCRKNCWPRERRRPAIHPLSRPPEVEGDAVRRALLMARLAGVPLYIVHVSSRQGIEAIAAARQAGQTVIAETCPQYLLLDESRYQGDADAAAALRHEPAAARPEHQAALWEALAAGIVQTLATDHCPFTLAEKKQFAAADFTRIPNGSGGIEYRLPLLYSFGVQDRENSPGPIRRPGLHPAGEDIRPVSAQGRRSAPAATPTWSSGTRKAKARSRQPGNGSAATTRSTKGLSFTAPRAWSSAAATLVFEDGKIASRSGPGNLPGPGSEPGQRWTA